MRIKEVSVELVGKGPLLAFARLLLAGPLAPGFGDDAPGAEFAVAVNGLKIIDGKRGLCVAMPDRRVTRWCVKCSGVVFVVAKFCPWCGVAQPPLPEDAPPNRNYADVLFPVDQPSRDYLHRVVIDAYLAKRREVDGPDLPAS